MHLLCTPQFHGRHQYLTCQVPVSCKLHIFFRLFANFYYTTNRGREQELGMENLFQVGGTLIFSFRNYKTSLVVRAPLPLRESCNCWKAEKLCRHFYRKCWTMDFRDGNLHNATLFCSNAQKSCNITKSFLLQCNSLWQKLPKTLFFQCDLSRNDLLKAENEEKSQLFMSIP